MMDAIAHFAITLAMLMIVLWMGAQIVLDFMKVSDKKVNEELAKDNCSDCPKDDCDCCPAEEYLEWAGAGNIAITTDCPQCGKRVLVLIGENQHELGEADVIKECPRCKNEMRVILHGVKILKPDKQNFIKTYHIKGGEEVNMDEKI